MTPYVELWNAPIAVRHITLSAMIFASILLVGSVAREADGRLSVAWRPVMWAVALWAVSHLLANGDLVSVVLFGGIAVVAAVGAWRAQVMPRRLFAWRPVILGLVLYAGLLVLHEPVIGIAPLPQVSGIFP